MGKLMLVSVALILCAVANHVEASRVVCYFGSWATYRWGNGKYDVENIDPFLCTHVIFTFVGLSDKPGIKVLDPNNELYDNGGRGALTRFTNLKLKNPALKVLLAIGGWNEGSYRYSTLLSTAANRAIFADDALAFIRKYGFDGLDLDWEYPAQRGGAPSDKSSFTELIKTLRVKFDPYGLLVTAAVVAAESSFLKSYDVKAIGEHLDFINVMAYDLHGSWETSTGHNGPLYASKAEIGTANEKLNVDAVMRAWIAHGAPANKLVMGIPSYGITFTLASTACTSPRCAASGTGVAGTWTAQPGFMGYNEICLLENTYSNYFDDEAKIAYMVNGRNWITYDSLRSVQAKVDYINKMKLGGGMIWSLETDDFLGLCGNGKYPILSAINKGVLSVPEATTAASVVTTTTQAPATTTKAPTTTTQAATTTTTTQAPATTTQAATTTTQAATTTTTTQAPATNNPCTTTGYIRDKNDCRVFYNCRLLPSGEFAYSKYTCSSNLVFDSNLKVCNYPQNVVC